MPIRNILRTRLTTAMRARDSSAVSAYRSALSAIGNAEALPIDAPPAAGAIERSPVGVGATEAPRRLLTEDDVRDVLRAEIDERRQARSLLPPDRPDLAARLDAETGALIAVLEA